MCKTYAYNTILNVTISTFNAQCLHLSLSETLPLMIEAGEKAQKLNTPMYL